MQKLSHFLLDLVHHFVLFIEFTQVEEYNLMVRLNQKLIALMNFLTYAQKLVPSSFELSIDLIKLFLVVVLVELQDLVLFKPLLLLILQSLNSLGML
jgi:hypothetical protein